MVGRKEATRILLTGKPPEHDASIVLELFEPRASPTASICLGSVNNDLCPCKHDSQLLLFTGFLFASTSFR
jgi:hypothetical protein